MMVKDGKVWLVRHTYLPGWFMPGGGVERNETLERSARREAQEEVGAELGHVSLIGVFSNFGEWKTDHTAVFYCNDFELTGTSDREIAEVRAFALDSLPGDTYETHRYLLEKYRSGAEVPNNGEW